MYLVQIILPRYDRSGHAIDLQHFQDVRETLLGKYGGVTAFTRSPAEGLWKDGSQVERDEVLLYEVMVSEIDRTWWEAYRSELECKFHQQEIVIRAHAIERL